MRKTAIIAIFAGLVGAILVLPAFAASPSAEYAYRIPVSIAASGGSVGDPQPLCLDYDPSLLVSLGYVQETDGSLEDVRLDNLDGADVYSLNTPDPCLWFNAENIGDGNTQTYSLYTGHPTDTRTPAFMLPDAAASIEIADVSSMRVSSNLTLELDDVTYSERPSTDHTLLEYPSSYTVVTKSDGTIETSIPIITSGTTTHPTQTATSGCYNTGNFSGCPSYGSYAYCTYCQILSTPTENYNYIHYSPWSAVTFANTCSSINYVRWTHTAQMYSSDYQTYSMPQTAWLYSGTSTLKASKQVVDNYSYGQSKNVNFYMYPADNPNLTCDVFTGGTFSIKVSFARVVSAVSQMNAYNSYGLYISYNYLTAGSPTVLTSTVTIPLEGGTYDYSLTYDSGTVTQTVDDGTTVDVQTAARTAAVSTPTGDWTLAGTNDAAVTLAGARVGASSIVSPTWKLDLDAYADNLTLVDAGDAGDGWSWEYDAIDQSGNGNDGAWAFASDHTGLTISLGTLIPTAGLPAILVGATLADTIGGLPGLTGTSSGLNWPGYASINAAITQAGAVNSTLWFILLAGIGLIIGAAAVRFTNYAGIGLVIAAGWVGIGWPLGLFPVWVAVVGVLTLFGTGAAMALVNRR